MYQRVKECLKNTEQSDRNKQILLKNYLDKYYTLDCSDKYEIFLKELGISKNVRNRAIAAKPKVSLSKENDEYVLSTFFAGLKDVKVKFKPGETVTRRRPGGAVATSVFQIVDNKLIEEQQVDGKTILIERTFTKKNLEIVMEVNDVKCRRMYTLSPTEHRIGTETSRRSSLWSSSTWSEFETPSQVTEISLENTITPKSRTESEDPCI